MLKVITIGSAVKDVFITPVGFYANPKKKFMSFEIGGKYEASQIFYDTGGGATNAAATLRNFGINCGCFTMIGNDDSGETIINDFKKRGVKLENIYQYENLGTGYSTVLMYPNGERSIIVYRGASSQFDHKNLNANRMQADWFYLTSVKGNIKFIDKTFKIAKKNKTKIFWNPGNQELSKGLKTIEKYLKETNILSLNVEEVSKLTGESSIRRNLNTLSYMCDFVVITNGKKGAYLAIKNEHYFIPSSGKPPLNTTGAGDAYGSGFLAGLIKYKNWQDAIKVAVWNSDGVISQMGAKHGLIEKMPTEKQMKKIKIKKI